MLLVWGLLRTECPIAPGKYLSVTPGGEPLLPLVWHQRLLLPVSVHIYFSSFFTLSPGLRVKNDEEAPFEE